MVFDYGTLAGEEGGQEVLVSQFWKVTSDRFVRLGMVNRSEACRGTPAGARATPQIHAARPLQTISISRDQALQESACYDMQDNCRMSGLW